MNWQTLRDLHSTATAKLRAYRGALRLLRPAVLDRDTAREFEAAAIANPLMHRFPKSERTRMHVEDRAARETARRLAGAVARQKAREVHAVIAQGREQVSEC